MNKVLEWVKANVFIVVFSVLMIAAVIVLPILSGRMNADVRNVLNERVGYITKLGQLERGEVIPGVTGVPVEAALRRYEQVSQVVAADAAKVREAAIEHNRKGRGVVLDGLFPEPPSTQLMVLPKRFHERLFLAYDELLKEIGAGMPPSLESLRRDLEMAKSQFITQDLRKSMEEKLEPDEETKLRETLSSRRLAMYVDAAEQIAMYVSRDQLAVPSFNDSAPPSLLELFNWQWQFWIIDDVLRALDNANGDQDSLLRAPVKRVLNIAITGLPAPAPSTGNPMGTSTGFGGAGVARTDAESPTAAAGVPANPKAPVARNFARSITGRVTNPLYDVLYVELGVVVESERLPQVLDALARYNFMTVTELSLNSVDPFQQMEEGFFYGSEPVVEVQLMLETVWLRDWTTSFMPPATKQTLGVPANAAAATVATDA